MDHVLRIKNNIGQLKELYSFVSEQALLFGLDEKQCRDLNLSLEEVVTNVILYAYPGKNDQDIFITLTYADGRLTATVMDTGIAFDPTAKDAPDLSLPADERPVGGLGIYLARKLMSEISYSRSGDRNTLTLIKNIHRGI